MLYLSICPLFRDVYHFLVSCPIPVFYAKILAFYAGILCYLGFYARYSAWCVCGEGGWGGGVPFVARRRLQPCMWCYLGVQFNLLARSSIIGPRPAPVPTWDWGAELRGSSVISTSQRRLRCICLPTPYLRKGFFPFICHESTQPREHN